MKHKPTPWHRHLISLSFMLSLQVSAQTAPPAPGVPVVKPTAPRPIAPTSRVQPPVRTEKAEELQSFKFEQADLDLVMSQYCAWTGKIYLKNEKVKASITIKADKLTTQESIEVIEAILNMNDIILVPMGEKFIKVIQAQATDLIGEGGPVNYDSAQKYAGTEKIVTQIIHLQNPINAELEKAIRQLMHRFGRYLPLENSNSVMITDTETNILRIRKLVEFLDQASGGTESRIYQIKYAEASEIAAKLNEIVAMAQADQKTTSRTPYRGSTRTPPGVIRARSTAPKYPNQGNATQTTGGGSAAPIIQGNVKVMADERTNIILIFSQKENFEFFDGIIKVLDIEIDPSINFEVINLEYADAEELSGTLNELVGAASGSRSSSSRSSSSSRTSSRRTSYSSRSRVYPRSNPTSTAAKSLSRLSENTKILADKRSNSILLMGEKLDIVAIKNVIKSLDIMLEQVLIEAAIFEVTIGDDLEHGIQWLYKSQGQDKMGSWDGVGLVTNAVGNVASRALTYYQAMSGIDTQVAIKLAAGDSNVRLLATPVIITTDNTEAKLSVGEQRPVVTSTDSFGNSSGTQRSNYEYKDIGIQLTVTPHINPQRVVMMEINQKADQVGDEVAIDKNNVPVILNREFEAVVTVPDRGTIALGGLINTEKRDTVSKIPILGDIPFIGRYLFSSVSKKNRKTELVVLLTPYVSVNEKEAERETKRIYDSMDMNSDDWPTKGWSESPLRNRPKPESEPKKKKKK